MAKYVIDETTLRDIANEIRLYDGTTDTLTPDDMTKHIKRVFVEGEDAGYYEGKAQGVVDFMDAYQANLEENGYSYAFAGKGWTDEYFNPPRPIVETFQCGFMFAQSSLTNTIVPITIDSADTSNTSLFAYCANLQTIPSLKVTEKVPAFTAWFHNCRALETLNFTADSVIAANIDFSRCNVLSNASVQTIINALKDLTGQTAKTLTLHADVGAALTDEQKAAITAKNWTLVY